jgi:hypothetical protein
MIDPPKIDLLSSVDRVKVRNGVVEDDDGTPLDASERALWQTITPAAADQAQTRVRALDELIELLARYKHLSSGPFLQQIPEPQRTRIVQLMAILDDG